MDAQATTLPAQPAPLTGGKLALGSFAVALATFMNVLDSSIANVAIPTIAGNLGVSVDEGTWVITLFAAANAVSIPLTGWLTQRIGQVRLFVATIVLFVLSSWLCGMAPNLPVLLAARILQGAVAGPMTPLSQAILLGSYPKEKSGTALALWAMTATVGPIAGPLLGGWITDRYSWSWVFYINIPVGLFAAAVTWFLYRDRESASRKLPIDKIGLASLVIWVAALQVMLDKGKDLDWFSSPFIVGLAVVALIGFVFFLIWELTDAHPIVELRLFAGHGGDLGGVCGVLRQPGDPAAMDAAMARLPGRQCGAGHRAAGHLCGAADAGAGPHPAEVRHARAGDRGVRWLCGSVLHALGLHHRRG
jgi:DHA2 family multidrug resistance protein